MIANGAALCQFSDELGAVEQNLSAEEYQLRQQHQSGGGGNGRPRTLSISPSLQLHQQQFLDHHMHTQASRQDGTCSRRKIHYHKLYNGHMLWLRGHMLFNYISLDQSLIGKLQVEEGEQGARHRPRTLRPRCVLPVGQVQGRIQIRGAYIAKSDK